ncbi:hypothetical protein CFP56_042910 [Quercus suber]|uniref:Uncharacterized protein n=1 Tax=Quercus suber TaxID=58331 RepID=A0AAW0LJA9_QUESU
MVASEIVVISFQNILKMCYVAKAKAPIVSIIRFTHSNWTVVSGTLPEETAATKLMTRAATLIVS